MKIQTRISLLLLTLLLAIPFAASLAAVNTVEGVVDNGSYAYRITTFDSEVPQELQQELDTHGFAGMPAYKGAFLEARFPLDKTRPNLLGQSALIALETGSGRTLVWLERDEHEKWLMADVGAAALLPGRDFTITTADPGLNPLSLNFRFEVSYPAENGGAEAYGFASFMPGCAYISTYARTDAAGDGHVIWAAYPNYGFQTHLLPLPEDFRRHEQSLFYPAYLPLWPEYMTSVADFPTTDEDAKRIAEASWARFDGTDLGMLFGSVNLREKATSSSKSLGQYQTGTLAHILGQEPGADAPWYHVRIGHREGWVSGIYLNLPNTQDFVTNLWHMPLPIAKTTAPRTLHALPMGMSDSLAELPEGTLMHIVGIGEGGWNHVMIPRGELSWEMDVEGLSGYIHDSEIVRGLTPGLLGQ